MAQRPLLVARSITKRFPGVLALREVGLSVHAGEVVAIIGGNGAGKSTLMKILAGFVAMDEGSVHMDGVPIMRRSPREATARGIVLIHQELSLLPNLSVGANIFLGREPRRYGFLRRQTIARHAARILARVGLDVSPGTSVASLPIGQRQLVEIARALSTRARLIIMDEPTSSLSEREVERLFGVIAELKADGVAILYVSHRLAEVEQIADRVAVLRDGRLVAVLPKDQITRDAMVRSMVGRDVGRPRARARPTGGVPVLEVSELTTRAWTDTAVSLALRRGEIVGLAGLVGAGRSELLRALFGLDPVFRGHMRVRGQPTAIRSPRDAIRAGIALVPEDRATQGLVQQMNVQSNLSLAYLARRRGAAVRRREESTRCRQMAYKLGIDAARMGSAARLLSGGNQQKVVLGKWLLLGPDVLLLDEPTRGIDVGAKHEIYQTMEALARRGMAILFASSEMEELLDVADRILVMHQGKIAGRLDHEQRTEQHVMRLATGSALATT